jgi:hypothetical protein
MAMQEQGLEIHPIPAEAAAEWRRIGDRGMQAVLGRMIPKESYDLIAGLVSEYNR